MSWIFRKVFKTGPVNTTVSKKGVGASISIFGLFRVGVTAEGRRFISFGIPGTGLYFRKLL
jgi:hypothetical protein